MVEAIIKILRKYYSVLVSSMIRRESSELPVVEADMDVMSVFRILASRHHVWVVETKENMKLIGIITEKDIIDIIAPKRISPYTIGGLDTRSILFGKTTTAGHMANKRLITVHPEDTIENVLLKMKRYRLRRLPVVKDGRLMGEITLHIVLQEFMSLLKWHKVHKAEQKTK